VIEFYGEPDISREMAGKKEHRSAKEGHLRVAKQKRPILCCLKEVYSAFKEIILI
jgi:hypothetical protein